MNGTSQKTETWHKHEDQYKYFNPFSYNNLNNEFKMPIRGGFKF